MKHFNASVQRSIGLEQPESGDGSKADRLDKWRQSGLLLNSDVATFKAYMAFVKSEMGKSLCLLSICFSSSNDTSILPFSYPI